MKKVLRSVKKVARSVNIRFPCFNKFCSVFIKLKSFLIVHLFVFISNICKFIKIPPENFDFYFLSIKSNIILYVEL